MKANIVVLSYNRPKMLMDALDSIFNSTHQDFDIWLYDDGSDFDIEQIALEYNDTRIILCRAPRISPSERVKPGSMRWPENINTVINEIQEGYITYLCDDDVFHPEWLAAASRALAESPSSHMILAHMFYYQNGEDPFTTGKEGFPARVQLDKDPDDESKLMWWNLGAFAYRWTCVEQCDVKWGEGLEGYAHSWDISLIDSLKAAHPGYVYLPIPSVYRREHENTLSYRMGRLDEEGIYVRAAGEMLPEHVEGFLE